MKNEIVLMTKILLDMSLIETEDLCDELKDRNYRPSVDVDFPDNVPISNFDDEELIKELEGRCYHVLDDIEFINQESLSEEIKNEINVNGLTSSLDEKLWAKIYLQGALIWVLDD